jgi:DNA repair exonuclease SbcCD ATPase subunit
MTQSSDRLDRVERLLENLAERQARFQQQMEQDRAEMNANHEYLGSEIGQLMRGLGELRQQVSAVTNRVDTLAQQAEQDRSQAAIDRAEFRSTVQQILDALTQRFSSNGHGE